MRISRVFSGDFIVFLVFVFFLVAGIAGAIVDGESPALESEVQVNP